MRQDSPYSVDARTAPNSAQVIQYGFSDRWLIIVLIIVAVLSLLFGVFALVRSSDAVATEAVLSAEIRVNNAKIEVLQYDHQALKAQLIEKGLYQPTEH